jgi:sulfhydrogenase subunit beta (sulfur reductase)
MRDANLYIIPTGDLSRLIEALRSRGYVVIGPTVRDDAIVYDEIQGAADLLIGWTDEQGPGTYRLVRRHDDRHFGFVVGADSWKKYLFPPVRRLFTARRGSDDSTDLSIEVNGASPPRYAFIGARACELAAMAVQDRVFRGPPADAYYHKAREQALIVAVNCIEPGGTCFCDSMGTGPRCREGYDICLTELDGHFAVEIGSKTGAEIVESLDLREATPAERRLCGLLMERSRARMGRTMETEGLPELLAESVDSPRWAKIAERCMSCGNCTMVCPTCFCFNVHDHTDLSGRTAERVRVWGSCFSLEFSYMGGHNVRTSAAGRYRQWMTHKLSSWHEQFGTSGCVGCGRCITWCPVGIDITEEARALRREHALKQLEAARKEDDDGHGA